MAVSPRRPNGPSLNALRAFEAAARLGSFLFAAEELGVTAGAVSQHVKAVEAWAGTALFERSAHGVSLSPPARKLTEEFTSAFDLLASATQNLRNLAPNPAIHIAALPSIAQLWLPARLTRLRELRPDLNVSVTALETPPRLSRELFDLAVFFSEPNVTADQVVLVEDTIFPVCAPILADNLDLEAVPLLHDQTWQDDWLMWSEGTGASIGDPSRGPRYSLYALAVEEAISGAGFLMGHGCLIEGAIHSGRLMRVSGEKCGTGRALVIDLPHKTRRHPEVDLILDALRDFESPVDLPKPAAYGYDTV